MLKAGLFEVLEPPFRHQNRQWAEEILKNSSNKRDVKWSESIAGGDGEFAGEVKSKPRQGIPAVARKWNAENGCVVLIFKVLNNIVV